MLDLAALIVRAQDEEPDFGPAAIAWDLILGVGGSLRRGHCTEALDRRRAGGVLPRARIRRRAGRRDPNPGPAQFRRNTKTYPSTQFNADEKTGYVLGLNLGGLKQKKDWLVGYYYAHIEKFAVVARLAQDDWLR